MIQEEVEMNPIMKKIVIIMFKICFAAGMLLFVYGSYLVVKPLSYRIFYEDMVRETVREMVKEESLRIGLEGL